MKNTIEYRRDFARIVIACLSTYVGPEQTARDLRTWFQALGELSLTDLAIGLLAHVGNPNNRQRPPTPADVLQNARRAV